MAVVYFLVATFNFFTCQISSSNLVTRRARKPLPENVSLFYTVSYSVSWPLIRGEARGDHATGTPLCFLCAAQMVLLSC